jgi:uncharacterized protein
MTSALRLQAMMAKACFGKERPFEDDLRAFLTAHRLDKDDVDALLASPRRLGLYRRLIRHNVTGVIGTMLERTKAKLDALAPGAFERTVDAFLDEVGPRTPHLRDVPSEFLSYAAPRWKKDETLPRWLVDHAELELVDFTIGVAPRAPMPTLLADVAADAPLVFAEPKTLVRLGWAVHEVASDPKAAPAERPVTILVYRDHEHATRFLELTPLAAAILERLFAGDPLGPAMVTACTAQNHPLDDQVLAGAAHLLADLGERGVLLGARAT